MLAGIFNARLRLFQDISKYWETVKPKILFNWYRSWIREIIYSNESIFIRIIKILLILKQSVSEKVFLKVYLILFKLMLKKIINYFK